MHTKRPYRETPPAVRIDVGGQLINVKAVGAGSLYVTASNSIRDNETPVVVRGVRYNASAHFTKVDGEVTTGKHGIHARKADEFIGDEASNPAKKKIEEIFGMAAARFFLEHTDLIQQADAAYLSNQIQRLDTDIEKKESELRTLLEERNTLIQQEEDIAPRPPR